MEKDEANSIKKYLDRIEVNSSLIRIYLGWILAIIVILLFLSLFQACATIIATGG